MSKDISTIDAIQREKQKEVESQETPPIDEEYRKLAEQKRFTFDVIDTPVDPLR